MTTSRSCVATRVFLRPQKWTQLMSAAFHHCPDTLNDSLVFTAAFVLSLSPVFVSPLRSLRSIVCCFQVFIFCLFFEPHPPAHTHTHTHAPLFSRYPFSPEYFICSNLLKSLLIFSPPTPYLFPPPLTFPSTLLFHHVSDSLPHRLPPPPHPTPTLSLETLVC